jgi:fucose permease
MGEGRRNFPILFIIYGDMILYGFVQSAKGVVFPLIKNEFNASYNEQGLLVGLVALVAVFFCVAAGVFIGRYGLKKALVLGFSLAALGMASFYFASGFWLAAGMYLVIQSGLSFFEISLNGLGVRIFTVKSALMISLLHFFYGAGAIAGPRFAGFITNRPDMNWRWIYPAALVPVFIMLIITLCIDFPDKPQRGRLNHPAGGTDREKVSGPEKTPFWVVIKQPMVWLFGLILGFGGAVEGGSLNWSVLYLQDVYGLDPAVSGAAFVSAFFVLYTTSRLISGFFIEKAGYMNSLLFAALGLLLLFISGFALGEWGIRILPLTGAFIAVVWPAMLAVSVGVFKAGAQTASGAIIAIAFTLNGIIQYGIGLTNRFMGAAWGYRSCLVYSLILLFLLYRLKRILQRGVSDRAA